MSLPSAAKLKGKIRKGLGWRSNADQSLGTRKEARIREYLRATSLPLEVSEDNLTLPGPSARRHLGLLKEGVVERRETKGAKKPVCKETL